MLSRNQVENLRMDCAGWLEKHLKIYGVCPIQAVCASGKEKGFTKEQIKAARAWHGKWISLVDDNCWGWDI